MDTESIIAIYRADRNPDENGLSGVPLRDLTAADLAGIPAWQIASVWACGFYDPVAPPPDPGPQPEPMSEEG